MNDAQTALIQMNYKRFILRRRVNSFRVLKGG